MQWNNRGNALDASYPLAMCENALNHRCFSPFQRLGAKEQDCVCTASAVLSLVEAGASAQWARPDVGSGGPDLTDAFSVERVHGLDRGPSFSPNISQAQQPPRCRG